MKVICYGLVNDGWGTDRMEMFSQNLVVGKNAVGKSTVIRSLSQMASIISQRKPLDDNATFLGMIAIEEDSYTVSYKFKWAKPQVLEEHLLVIYANGDKKVLIDRTHDEAKLEGSVVNPPQDKLLLNLKRDIVLYPEIETVISWAENVDAFSFNEFDIDGDESLYSRFIKGGNNLFTMIKELPAESINNIIKAAENLQYYIDKIEPVELGDIKKVLFIEKGVNAPLFDFNLSKGMFRTLYLLIYLEYIAKSGKPTTLLIDDLCEGLDYDRSTKLGKYVFEFCSTNSIQLMATSNDSFLMDVVDLKYWSILRRNGSKVSAINHKNSSELFDDFSFTGLSNFDLLSSDFIERHTNK